MFLFHFRTIAFITSLSTAIQCTLWFVGYILYALAYSCAYKSTYFLQYPNEELPLTLPSYFIWYIQGSNCTTSEQWISSTRGESADLLMILFSIGFGLNCALLGCSILVLVVLYINIGLFSAILPYSIAVYIVSAWDVVLVVTFVLDFVPLLQAKHYFDFKINDSHAVNQILPGDMAMSFFISVFIVIFLALVRFIFIWIFNLVCITYLVVKNKRTKGNPEKKKPPNPKYKNNKKTSESVEPPWSQSDPNTIYFGLKKGALSDWHTPTPLEENPHDEVNRRWTMSTGANNEEDSLSTSTSASIDDSDPALNARRNIILNNGHRFNEERWKDVENHIRRSDEIWRTPNEDQSILPNVRRDESFARSSSLPKRQSFLKNIRESFRKNPPEAKLPQILPEVPQSKHKPIEGFTHFASTDSDNRGSVDVNEMFGVKLRHVQRPSIPNDQTGSTTDHSGSNQAVPYAVSPIMDVDPEKFKPLFFPAKIVESNSGCDAPPAPPPDVPPPDAPPLKNPGGHNGVNKQMSLEEAIRTRRPLKPVSRPGIDTTC